MVEVEISWVGSHLLLHLEGLLKEVLGHCHQVRIGLLLVVFIKGLSKIASLEFLQELLFREVHKLVHSLIYRELSWWKGLLLKPPDNCFLIELNFLWLELFEWLWKGIVNYISFFLIKLLFVFQASKPSLCRI